MNEYINTSKVPTRILSLFISITSLYEAHDAFKSEPTQPNLDSLTQAATDFEMKVEIIRKTLAESVQEIIQEESSSEISGESTPEGIRI